MGSVKTKIEFSSILVKLSKYYFQEDEMVNHGAFFLFLTGEEQPLRIF
jgi:hypothetical protein